MNIFFDVQGTLISGGSGRPHIRDVFEKLSGRGHHIYLWSSAGSDYAKNAAESLGVEDLIFGYYSKYAPPPVSVDFTVDDHPDFVSRYGGCVVAPFSGDPADRELLRIVEELEPTG